MTIYVIEEDLGPSYSLRLPFENENLDEKVTVEVSTKALADYRIAETAWAFWQEGIGTLYRTKHPDKYSRRDKPLEAQAIADLLASE